jgi:hypothetical protein
MKVMLLNKDIYNRIEFIEVFDAEAVAIYYKE